jgi:ribosomal protein S18 acetylase RimI-like enzyme
VDERLAPVPIVSAFAHAVRPLVGVVGFYAGGSLASGDFQPGVSDLDLVAVIAAELDDRRREELRRLHEVTRRQHSSAANLHCLYVPLDAVADVSAAHPTWAHGELFRRAFSTIARAELLQDGIIVLGPPPAELLPPVDLSALQAGARDELAGYWSGAVRKPWIWLHDSYVDLGLLTLARAEVTLRDGRLITKREALTRLHRFEVPDDLVQQIARRRQGEEVSVARLQRARRARTARRLVARGIHRLLNPERGPGSVRLRPARPSDVRAIAEFHTECWREAYRDLVPQTYLDRVSAEDRAARWRDRLTTGSRKVALADAAGVIVGVVSWGDSEDSDDVPSLELKSLYVAAGQRGSGVAAALMEQALGTAPAHLWVFEDNRRALAFYSKHGFVPDGERKIDADTGIWEQRLVRR